MSIPLRVNKGLFREAEIEGSLLNRSAAKQVEFWAELGKRVAHSVTSADLLALMQGIAAIHVKMPESQPVPPEDVFATVDRAGSSGQLGVQITQQRLYYEASKNRPGMLERVMPDGRRDIGHFSDGAFVPE